MSCRSAEKEGQGDQQGEHQAGQQCDTLEVADHIGIFGQIQITLVSALDAQDGPVISLSRIHVLDQFDHLS